MMGTEYKTRIYAGPVLRDCIEENSCPDIVFLRREREKARGKQEAWKV